MNSPSQFLWHDYETFGTHPAIDRPAQFAAIRTDSELNAIGEPVEWYCAPADDLLPHPVACLITGITPQTAREKGVTEAKFAKHIHAEMMQPGTCSVGYNSLKFDDEFSRNIFYRNFRDPYEREWRNGNSRFDLINLARMCFALRPDGIEWPLNEEGKPSFRLEHLTKANNIGHEGAHDALADVRATIDLARLIRQRQPKLFNWALGLRDQKAVLRLLDVLNPKPVLHTSSRIPANRGCTSLFLPLAVYPDRPKSIIAIDLMSNPDTLISGTAEEISDLVFITADALPEDMERIPLKAIHSNKLPMLAPSSTLKGVDTNRIALDPELCNKNADRILGHLESIRMKVMEVFTRSYGENSDDPDLMLYSGDFFSSHDRALMNKILLTKPVDLASLALPFQDKRLTAMLFRYRARNFPETMSSQEAEKWLVDRKYRATHPPVHGKPGLEELHNEVKLLKLKSGNDPHENRILDQLDSWYQGLAQELQI
ncbi:MAG: exodeoxyribonuclease-1 [Lysobacterales bacterium]|jgi:exodeoxyribonuclease-1